jgi:hypothetical protein
MELTEKLREGLTPWIATSERLPESDRLVLVHLPRGSYGEGYYNRPEKGMWWVHMQADPNPDYWMYMPELP